MPYPGLPQRVAETLRDQGVLECSVITSIQLGTVCEAVSFAMPSMHAWLVTPDLQTDLGLQAVCAAAQAHGVPMLALRSNMVDADVVRSVREAGLEIGAWACNDAATIRRVFALQVAGFTTDRPDLALQLRG